MRKIYKTFILLVALSFALTACYEDLGNYNYSEINDVLIKAPEQIGVRIPRKDSVLVEVKPEISQTTEGKSDVNLRYEWKKEVAGVGAATSLIVGTERVCSVYVKSTDRSDFTLQLSVTDTEQNIVTYSETRVRLIRPYSRAWFVLQNVSDASVLGCVDGEGQGAVVIKNVYAEEQPTGIPLKGKPIALEVNYRHRDPNIFLGFGYENIFRVITSNDGYTFDASNLKIRHSYTEMLLHKRLAGGDVNPQMLSLGDEFGEYIIDNGVFWAAPADGFDIYYPVKISEELGSYRATNASSLRDNAIVYDAQNKRFLLYYFIPYATNYFTQQGIRGGNYSQYDVDGRTNIQRLQSIGESADALNEFNPNNISQGGDVTYMGVSNDREDPTCMALFAAGQKVSAYEFDYRGFYNPRYKRCSGYFEVDLTDTPNAGCFATSSFFNRMFFYASGNKIYRVDLSRAVPRDFLIYEHPDAGAKITHIKFRHQQYELYNFDTGWSAGIPSYLGASVEYPNGENGMIEIKIARRGDIDKDENGNLMISEWAGFDKIVDFGYNYVR